MPATPVVKGEGRLFFVEGGGGPLAEVTYEGFARAGRPAVNFGDVTNHYAPSRNARRQYTVISKTSGAESPPELPITKIYDYAISRFLELGRRKCDHDLIWAMGQCQLPQNLNTGYDKLLILEKARITSWGTDGDIGSLSPDDEGVVNEEVPFAGEALYEVKRFDAFGQIGAATFVHPLVDVVLGDEASCGGVCGLASDGCEKVFFLGLATVGSAGLSAAVGYTADGGSTPGTSVISTLAANEDPNAIGFDGTYIFVVSEDSESLHYATRTAILAGAGSWTEVTTGFVATKGPQALYVAGPSDIFIVGEGGYVYKSVAVPDGVSTLDAGSATTENLNSVHGIDENHVAAVGNNNAFIITSDGESWASKTGPAPGVVLNRVFMVTKDLIWVGTAGGRLYFTTDGGTTWTEKGFSGNGVGAVRDIVFVTRLVGFMAHNTAAPDGRIFKTVDGGATWVVLPEVAGSTSIPTHDYTSRIAPCGANTFYAAGLSASGTSGFAMKAS